MNRSTQASNASLPSNQPYTEDFNLTLKLISISFLILIIILTLVGNLLVISAFALFRKLRSVTNHFIVSLAFTDLLVALFSMPVWAAFLSTGPQWTFPPWLRKAWSCMDILCGVASILHLSFISVERYICISTPLKYHEIVTSSKSRVAIAIVWVVACIMAVIKFVTWGFPPPAYQLSAFILCFVLPTLTMSTAYLMIFKVSRTQARKMTLTVNGKSKRFCLPKELKAAKTLAVVMGAFLLCWLPFFLVNIIYAVCSECQINMEHIMLTKWLHYLNSLLNPIIYGCLNRDFRTAFKKLCIYVLAKLLRKATSVDQIQSSTRSGRLSSRVLTDVL